MSTREAREPFWPKPYFRPGAALREVLSEGYDGAKFRADLMAGLVVGVVALPLSMALAIASGVAPQNGLYTAIIAGLVIALTGGSRCQVSGPTAAFVVILAPIVTRFGVGGLLLATVLAGLMLILMGLFRLGRLIQYVPYPVTAGFTAGIGLVIATLQLKDFLGLTVPHMPEHYLERVAALGRALPSTHFADALIGAFTLAVLILWPKLTKKVPGPLVAIALATVLGAVLAHFAPDLVPATLGSKFSYKDAAGIVHPGIPRLPPMPALPWSFGGPGGQPLHVSTELVQSLLGSAFAIAMLGSIESLLSAVVSDGMAGTRHDPDAELLGQGLGNLIAPFFGGIAATGAIARTGTNIRAGAKSPFAAITHAIFVLAAMLVLAPVLAYIPMASLAALLILVAWNMSELPHAIHVMRRSPKSDVLVFLSCFALTAIFDMVVGVSVGVVLAALLFMRRMAEITDAELSAGVHPELRDPLPKGVVLYEIAGPLFFGAAQKAMSTLETVSDAQVVILDVEMVPAMDATGLVNLESALKKLASHHAFVILAGVQRQPRTVLARAGIQPSDDSLAMAENLHEAVALARARMGMPPAATASA